MAYAGYGSPSLWLRGLPGGHRRDSVWLDMVSIRQGLMTFVRLAVLSCLATVLHGQTLLRIASGGPGGTDAQGNVWSPDAFANGGATWINCGSSTTPVCPTGLAAPYLNLRYQTSFSYTLQVSPGFYNLMLEFIEPNKTGPNQRLFNVSVNGLAALSSFDVFQASGGALVPLSRTFPVMTTNGAIQIQFTGTLGNAIISGIELNALAAIQVDVFRTPALTYNLTRSPSVNATVYVNGLLMQAGTDYTIDGTALTFIGQATDQMVSPVIQVRYAAE